MIYTGKVRIVTRKETKMLRFFSVLLLISIFLFTACDKNSVPADQENALLPAKAEASPTPTVDESSMPENNSEPTATPNTADGEEAFISLVPDKTEDESGYQVIDITVIRKAGGKMVYPMITGMKDTGHQNRINGLIMEDVLAFADTVQTKGITIDLSYEISWQGKRLLSIRYTMYYEAEGAAHPSILFYSANIDMKNEKKLKLSDVVEIDDELIGKYQKDAEYTGPLEKDDRLLTILSEYLGQVDEKALARADGKESDDTIHSYFTKDSLGVAISVPHVIGDYARYELKFEDIRNLLILDNPIWDDFPDLFAE